MPLAFKDVLSEVWREYVWPAGATVRIEEPRRLHVSASGGHRIEDAEGLAHYVPTGWIHLKWQARKGAPAFAF